MLKYKAQLNATFQALMDPSRRQIVEALARGPSSVSALAKPLEMTLSGVMQHLAVLELAGLVRSDKRGRVRTCMLDAGALSAAETWLSQRRREWEGHLDRLGAYLATMDDEEEQPHDPHRG